MYDDPTPTRTAFPNYTWSNGLSNAGLNNSLFLAEGEVFGAFTYSLGDFKAKASYLSQGQMGWILATYANFLKIKGLSVDSRLEEFFSRSTRGIVRAAGDNNGLMRRLPLVLIMNQYWPDRVADNLEWIKSLPSTDFSSDDYAVAGERLLAFSFYDDLADGGSSVPVAPTIQTEPISINRVVGTSAVFSVIAAGSAPLSYQWRKGGSNISGATASTYSIASVSLTDAGTFSVVVTNSVGSVTSANATLTVSEAATAPSIGTNPVSATVLEGQPVSFSVIASGTSPLTYQWRKNASNISGATLATYSILSAAEADEGSYSCVVTNGAGSATSSSATLTVNPYVPPDSPNVWPRKRRNFIIQN